MANEFKPNDILKRVTDTLTETTKSSKYCDWAYEFENALELTGNVEHIKGVRQMDGSFIDITSSNHLVTLLAGTRTAGDGSSSSSTTIPIPPTGPTAAGIKSTNKLIVSTIKSKITRQLAVRMGKSMDGTAMELWKALERKFVVVSVVRESQALREWQAVRPDGRPVDEFVTDFWAKWEEYTAMGGMMGDKTKVVQFLEAIYDEYPAVYNKYAYKKSIEIDEIVTAMKIDETRKESMKLQSSFAANVIKTRPSHPQNSPPKLSLTCYNRNSAGHLSCNCRKACGTCGNEAHQCGECPVRLSKKEKKAANAVTAGKQKNNTTNKGNGGVKFKNHPDVSVDHNSEYTSDEDYIRAKRKEHSIAVVPAAPTNNETLMKNTLTNFGANMNSDDGVGREGEMNRSSHTPTTTATQIRNGQTKRDTMDSISSKFEGIRTLPRGGNKDFVIDHTHTKFPVRKSRYKEDNEANAASKFQIDSTTRDGENDDFVSGHEQCGVTTTPRPLPKTGSPRP
ncbi:hypothetical protein HDU93_003873, partial [Gonapodya sp. JEL0774]